MTNMSVRHYQAAVSNCRDAASPASASAQMRIFKYTASASNVQF